MKRNVYVFITPLGNEWVTSKKFNTKEEESSWKSRIIKEKNYVLAEVFDAIPTRYGLKEGEIKVGMKVKYKIPHSMYIWDAHSMYVCDQKIEEKMDDKNHVFKLSNGEIARWDGTHFLIGDKETILEAAD